MSDYSDGPLWWYLGAGAVLLTIFLFCLFATVGAFITMWAWNFVMPFLFGLPTITFWQALAVNILFGVVRSATTVVIRQK